MTFDNRIVVQNALVLGGLFGRVDFHDQYGVQGRVARIGDVDYERIVQVLGSFTLVAQIFAVH